MRGSMTNSAEQAKRFFLEHNGVMFVEMGCQNTTFASPEEASRRIQGGIDGDSEIRWNTRALYKLMTEYAEAYAASIRAEERERCAKIVESYVDTPHSACRNALQPAFNAGCGSYTMIGHREDCFYSIAAAIRQDSGEKP